MERFIDVAIVTDVFQSPKFGTMLGCKVARGKLKASATLGVYRGTMLIGKIDIAKFHRFTEEIDDVVQGKEFGVVTIRANFDLDRVQINDLLVDMATMESHVSSEPPSLSREEFLTLPPGTLYSEFYQGLCIKLSIKGNTSSTGKDFEFIEMTDVIDLLSSGKSFAEIIESPIANVDKMNSMREKVRYVIRDPRLLKLTAGHLSTVAMLNPTLANLVSSTFKASESVV